MPRKESHRPDGAELRRRAEARISSNPGTAPLPEAGNDPFRLLHELQVHQVELEMQNAELRRAIDDREKTELLLGTYADLYDFAPMGYLTLDRTGEIRAANLTAALLLGTARSLLVRRRLGDFVAEGGVSTFNGCLAALFEERDRKTCEMALRGEGGRPIFVRMEGVVAESGRECRVALVDVSDRKRAEDELAAKVSQLETALARVRQLEGMLPICAYCKKIKDDRDNWHQVEKYITEHSEAFFSHGICPDCLAREMSALKKPAK